MAAAAHELGFTYTAWMGPESAPKFQTALFQEHSGAALKNLMTGNYGGLDALVFDYSYTTGSAQNSSTVGHTVALYTQNVDLPSFTLGPESLAEKIVDALEHRRVELDCPPSFSRHYAVRGPEKEKIRLLFNGNVISLIESLDCSKQWHIEGAGKTLVLYRYRRHVKPAELRDFLQETSSIAQSFFAFCRTKSN